jgi:DNA-binding NarL/FixJ family response regulator
VTPTRMISLVIADDHSLVIGGLKGLIGHHSQFKVVEWCSEGASALAAIRKHRPNIAVSIT